MKFIHSIENRLSSLYKYNQSESIHIHIYTISMMYNYNERPRLVFLSLFKISIVFFNNYDLLTGKLFYSPIVEACTL